MRIGLLPITIVDASVTIFDESAGRRSLSPMSRGLRWIWEIGISQPALNVHGQDGPVNTAIRTGSRIPR